MLSNTKVNKNIKIFFLLTYFFLNRKKHSPLGKYRRTKNDFKNPRIKLIKIWKRLGKKYWSCHCSCCFVTFCCCCCYLCCDFCCCCLDSLVLLLDAFCKAAREDDSDKLKEKKILNFRFRTNICTNEAIIKGTSYCDRFGPD